MRLRTLEIIKQCGLSWSVIYAIYFFNYQRPIYWSEELSVKILPQKIRFSWAPPSIWLHIKYDLLSMFHRIWWHDDIFMIGLLKFEIYATIESAKFSWPTQFTEILVCILITLKKKISDFLEFQLSFSDLLLSIIFFNIDKWISNLTLWII